MKAIHLDKNTGYFYIVLKNNKYSKLKYDLLEHSFSSR